ncbi:MAG: hypothetical protein ACI9JN_001418 [Bacteroidia bacterium]|jgi:hypothetical protein
MKIIKYVLIFVGFGLVGTFIAAFFVADNHVVEHDIELDQPLEQAWDAVFNPAKIVMWRDNLDTVESLTGKYDETGFKALFVFSDAEQVSKPVYEVDSVFRHESATSSIILSEKIRLDTKYEFEAIDANTSKLHVTTKLTPSGWMYKVMFSSSGNGLAVKRKAELEKLQKWLSNQTKTPAQ